jgi:hypothetical protein
MMIDFVCNNEDCNNHITKSINNVKDIPPFLDCGECSIGKLERVFGAPSSKSVQYVDNGLQAREVEVLNEVVEKERERHTNKG